MRRVLQNELVDKLSKEILRGTFQAGDTIYVDVDPKGLTFSKEPYDGVTRYPESVDGTHPLKDADVLDVEVEEVKDLHDVE